jgi:hypothetical protein
MKKQDVVGHQTPSVSTSIPTADLIGAVVEMKKCNPTSEGEVEERNGRKSGTIYF